MAEAFAKTRPTSSLKIGITIAVWEIAPWAVVVETGSSGEDLAFWDRHGIDTVGVSVAKLARFGWAEGTRRVADAVARGLRVANRVGLGPFHLADPPRWAL